MMNKHFFKSIYTFDPNKVEHGGYIIEDPYFQQRHLNCPFEMGSFDMFTYSGKPMEKLEDDAYKLWRFIE